MKKLMTEWRQYIKEALQTGKEGRHAVKGWPSEVPHGRRARPGQSPWPKTGLPRGHHEVGHLLHAFDATNVTGNFLGGCGAADPKYQLKPGRARQCKKYDRFMKVAWHNVKKALPELEPERLLWLQKDATEKIYNMIECGHGGGEYERPGSRECKGGAIHDLGGAVKAGREIGFKLGQTKSDVEYWRGQREKGVDHSLDPMAGKEKKLAAQQKALAAKKAKLAALQGK